MSAREPLDLGVSEYGGAINEDARSAGRMLLLSYSSYPTHRKGIPSSISSYHQILPKLAIHTRSAVNKIKGGRTRSSGIL